LDASKIQILAGRRAEQERFTAYSLIPAYDPNALSADDRCVALERNVVSCAKAEVISGDEEPFCGDASNDLIDSGG
jgi:hypothetical protein